MTQPIAPDDRDFITALARGLELLQICGSSESGLTLAEIAEASGLSRATVRRFLLTLMALDYIDQEGRRYHLTPRVLALGSAYLGSTPLPRVARPFLERISRDLNESCSMGTLDGLDVVYVARVQVSRIMSIDLGVGSRLPAVASSMGRVLLASLPPARRAERLADAGLVAHTPHTLTDRARLLALLADVEARGFCIVDQELEQGLRSIAVPVRNAIGHVVAALNVGTNAGRVSLDEVEHRYLPLLQAAAQEMRALLLA